MNGTESRQSAPTGGEDRPLNVEEAARYLDLSPSYLYKLTSRGEIPHYKPNGKRLYFLKSDLRKWILRGRVAPQEEIEAEAATRVALNR